MPISFKAARNLGFPLIFFIVVLMGLVPSFVLTRISKPNANMSRKLLEIQKAVMIEELLSGAKSHFNEFIKGESQDIDGVISRINSSIGVSGELFKIVLAEDKKERKLVLNFEEAGKRFKIAVYAYKEERVYDPAGSGAIEMQQVVMDAVEKTHETLFTLVRDIQEDINRERILMEKRIREGQTLAIIGLLGSIVCGFVVSFLMSKALSGPLHQLLQGTNKIADGDLTHRIEINTKDEIGQLAASFNNMAENLYQKEAALKKSNRELATGEQHLKDILSAITNPIYIINASDHSLQLLNPAAENMAGKNALSALKCYQMSHKQDTPCLSKEHPCPMKKVVETKEPTVMEHIHTDENGNTRLVELQAFPIFDASGEVVQVVESQIDITARRKMEEDLRITQFAVDHSADAIFLIDPEGRFKYVNSAACNSLGYTEDELMSMTLFNIDAGYFGDILQYQWKLLKKCGSMTFITKHKRKNGEIFPVELTANYLDYEDREYSYVFVRDITKRKEAEDALIKAEQQKSVVLGSISELVVHVNSERKILWANRAAQETFGKSEHDLRNTGFCENLCGMESRCDSEQCPLKKIAFTDKIEEAEIASGDKTWAVKCYPVLSDASGGTVVVVQDITGQKRAESELLRVYTAVEEAMEAIIITDIEGHATYINRAFTDVLGYDAEDLKKRTIYSIYADEEDKEKFELHSEDKWRSWQWKSHAKKSDGRIIPVLVRSAPIPDKNNIPVEMLFIITDMTQHEEEDRKRKQLEFQLLQAQKLESIGQLAAGIAHEINTPTQFVGDNTNFLQDSFGSIIRIIDSYRELLDAEKNGAVSPELISGIEEILEKEDLDYLKEEVPEAISQSLGGIKRIADIVLAMKEFSHPNMNEKKAVNINKAIENTLTVSRNEWKYVADVKTEFTEDSPLVQCYLGELNQVFLNMFVNAAHTIADANKAREISKGLITVKTERMDKFFRVSIGDTGMGIPEEIRPRVFDMFFTTKEVGKGTGQGLFLAYNVIVNKHEGRLTFDTEFGKGTTFHIDLPLQGE